MPDDGDQIVLLTDNQLIKRVDLSYAEETVQVNLVN